MKNSLAAAVAAVLAASPVLAAPPAWDLSLEYLSSISTASAEDVGAEIVAYDPGSRRAFAINSEDNDLAVIDLTDPAAPILQEKIALDEYGVGLNSVATFNGLVAIAVEAAPRTNPGRVVFLDAATLQFRGDVEVGALPDMVTFDGDGTHVLVANEGEPIDYLPGSFNPEGSVSIIDLSQGVAAATVRTADFSRFDRAELNRQGIRVFAPGTSAAQDLEPEYITVHGRTAWVTLQEANAVAVVDVPTATVQTIVPLGLKNYSLEGNKLDGNDQDGVKIVNRPVFGMYQPDAIAQYHVRGQRFLVTANEGDSRSSEDFPGYNEQVRLSNAGYVLDPTVFPDAATLKQNPVLGRLNVTNASGDTDGDGDFDRIETFGGRSFSIWTAEGELVWDSGDQLEQFFADTANGYAAVFNASSTNNTRDNRSDDKGPEPEGVAIGVVGGRTYAFIGLERMGGVMAYDVSNPRAPAFAAYANTRNLTELEKIKGDRGAEGVTFIPGEDSPNGQPLVLVGNEASRTVSVFQVNKARP